MSEANSDLALSEITKDFCGVAGTLQILRGVELNLKRGNALAISGPSGSGKSTLLYIIGTLEQPTSGSVNILGNDPFTLTTAELADFRNRNIGFIFQDHHLLPQCSVLENVLILKVNPLT